MTGTNPLDYVRAFERNCPDVRLYKTERDELMRLFKLMRDMAQETVR